MAQKRPSKPNKSMRQRVSFLILVFAVLGFVVVAAKLFYMQEIGRAHV